MITVFIGQPLRFACYIQHIKVLMIFAFIVKLTLTTYPLSYHQGINDTCIHRQPDFI